MSWVVWMAFPWVGQDCHWSHCLCKDSEDSWYITSYFGYITNVFTGLLSGDRTKTPQTDLSEILPEDVEEEVKAAAEISMGTEVQTQSQIFSTKCLITSNPQVSEEDISNIIYLCDQIIDISQYRTQLYDYLKNRMMAIAPNLTVLVGELVGARLISHAGVMRHCYIVYHKLLRLFVI